MIRRAKRFVPAKFRPSVTAAYRRLSHWYARPARTLDRRVLSCAGFTQLLADLGVGPGATVMVHSSMDQVGRRVPELNALTLIRLLQQLLGPAGTLLMPTFPFSGFQRHYVDTHDSFDVKNTASRVGLVTEVFRRMPGVVRSLHPTHPVAGWGKYASDLLATHHLGSTFGPTSPFHKLRERGGLVVGLGTSMRESFTIQHVAEELHPWTRASAYEPEPRLMSIIDGARQIPYWLSVLKPGLEGKFDRIERVLLRDGTVTCVTRRGLRCDVTHADRFITRTLDLIDRGMYGA